MKAASEKGEKLNQQSTSDNFFKINTYRQSSGRWHWSPSKKMLRMKAVREWERGKNKSTINLWQFFFKLTLTVNLAVDDTGAPVKMLGMKAVSEWERGKNKSTINLWQFFNKILTYRQSGATVDDDSGATV